MVSLVIPTPSTLLSSLESRTLSDSPETETKITHALWWIEWEGAATDWDLYPFFKDNYSRSYFNEHTRNLYVFRVTIFLNLLEWRWWNLTELEQKTVFFYLLFCSFLESLKLIKSYFVINFSLYFFQCFILMTSSCFSYRKVDIC